MEVKIKNFRSIVQKNYVFEKGNNLITGESGKGKSTIMEAIFWCFHGGSNVSPFQQTKKKTITHVEIILDEIKIERNKPPDKCTVILPDLTKLEHDEAQEYINKNFGSKSLWETSCYLKQDTRSNLLFHSSQEKYSIIKEIVFGMDNQNTSPEKYLQRISSFSKDLDRELQTLQGKIEVLEEINSQFPTFDDMMKDTKKLEKNMSRYDKIKECLDVLKNKLHLLESKDKWQEELKKCKKDFLNYPPSLDFKTIVRWEKWSILKTDEEDPCVDIDINEENFNLRNLKEEKENYLINEKKCSAIKIKYSQESILEEINALEKKIKGIEEYQNYVKIMKNIEKINQEEEKLKSVFDDLKSKEPAYKKTFLAIMGKLDLESSGDYTLEEVEKINLKIKTIQTDYMKCPSCNKNLVMESGELKMKKCVFMKKEDIDKYNRNLNNINSYYRNLYNSEAKLRNIISLKKGMEIPQKVEKMEGDFSLINKKLKILREIKFFRDTDQDILHLEEKIRLYNLSQKIKAMKESYLPMFDEYPIPNNFNLYYSFYSELKNRIHFLTSNINDAGELDKNYIDKNIKKLESSLEDLERYKIYKQYLQNNEKLNNVKEKRNELLKKREGCTVLKKIIEEESSNTFESLIVNFNDSLNEIVSEIFEDISINLGMFKRLKGKGELKPQFNMNVILKGNEYDNLHFLSGGEKDRISIALTLTLSNLLNNPVIMFDESMSSLDEEMRERCLDLIRKYASDKILINVCHSTIEGYYDNIIRI